MSASVVAAMKNIEGFFEDGGETTLGALGGIECAASAADGHNCLAMLVRREGESLNATLPWRMSAIRHGDTPCRWLRAREWPSRP